MKNNKKQAKHKFSAVHFHVLLCVILSVVLLGGCSRTEQQANTDEKSNDAYTNKLYTEPPVLSTVEVVKDDYSFTYAGERASVILTEDTDKGLEFFAKLQNGKTPIFTLIYDSQEGDIVPVLVTESGEHIPVAFMMYDMPEGLSEEDALSFVLAQEAINEIVESIKLK